MRDSVAPEGLTCQPASHPRAFGYSVFKELVLCPSPATKQPMPHDPALGWAGWAPGAGGSSEPGAFNAEAAQRLSGVSRDGAASTSSCSRGQLIQTWAALLRTSPSRFSNTARLLILSTAPTLSCGSLTVSIFNARVKHRLQKFLSRLTRLVTGLTAFTPSQPQALSHQGGVRVASIGSVAS